MFSSSFFSSTLCVIIAALVPVVVLVGFICFRDRKRPEPPLQLLKAFALGLLAIPMSFGVSIPMTILRGSGEVSCLDDAVYQSFFCAAIPEELAKLVCLFWLLRKNRHFNEYMDGIVYATMISLGFAAFENIMYLFTNLDDWIGVSVNRGLYAVPGHFLFAVLMGYYYSLWRINGHRRSFVWMLLAPVLAHGIYDTICFSSGLNEYMGGIVMVALTGFVVFMWIRCSKLIKYHLLGDDAREILVKQMSNEAHEVLAKQLREQARGILERQQQKPQASSELQSQEDDTEQDLEKESEP